MELLSSKTDRFGYYRVGDQKIYSKLEATKLHTQTGIHPTWHFNDEIFSCYNWAVEPTLSLPDLYKKRAEQIREKYDYVVLLYSGGSDSHNILDTFVNNNIHVDEICTFHYLSGAKGEGIKNKEMTDVAIPYAQKIISQHPEINHRIIDLTDYLYNYYLNGENVERAIYEQSSTLNPNMVVRRRVHELVPFYQEYILSGKKICFVWGTEKPRVYQENGRYAIRFVDMVDGAAHPGSDAPVELFYWSPDLPELIIKQAHIVKRYLQNSNEQSRFMSFDSPGITYKEHNNKKLWLSVHGLNYLIYPTWDINTFTVGKAPSPMFAPIVNWFTSLTNDRANQNYFDLVNKWWDSLPDYWKNDVNDWTKGGKGCWSKSYYLD